MNKNPKVYPTPNVDAFVKEDKYISCHSNMKDAIQADIALAVAQETEFLLAEIRRLK